MTALFQEAFGSLRPTGSRLEAGRAAPKQRSPRMGDAESGRFSLTSFWLLEQEGRPNAAAALSCAVSDRDGDGVRHRCGREPEIQLGPLDAYGTPSVQRDARCSV